MDKTLRVLNDLVQQRLISQCAIGGAMALLFYTEPAVTYDLDVFCLLPASESPLVTLSPIYEHLERRGCTAQHEHVMIEGIPVRFIPAYNALDRSRGNGCRQGFQPGAAAGAAP
ncbi:MAG: hypothetical protein HZA90_20595 [Verrucomicrobia bacterium]|nr:hypothetical protein [Verrucomicrobiota bacterium]